MADPVLTYKRAEHAIVNDFNLTESQKSKLLSLLERNFVGPEALIGKSSQDYISLLIRQGHLVKEIEPKVLTSVYSDKPVYLCKMTNEMNKKTVNNCELLLDTGNIAVDLLFSYRDALKFDLVQSEITTEVCGYKSEVTLVKMLPPLLVKFQLKDSSGEVEERKASLDVYVSMQEIDDYNAHLASITKNLSPSESPEKADGHHTEVPKKPLKRKIDACNATPSAQDDENTPVNDPSPVRYTGTGTANLGGSGAEKLRLRYDTVKKEIFFLQPREKLSI